ncbi:glutathione S-transferase, putative, partial [Ixodes scapularis]
VNALPSSAALRPHLPSPGLRQSAPRREGEARMTLVVYNQYGSPPCGFIRMLAKHLGLDVKLHDLNLLEGEHLTPDYLKLNPFHRVPTIDDNGFVLYESLAICSYLLDAYGAHSDLKVDCVKTRARVNQALAVITSTVQPHYFKFFKPRFFEQKKPTSAEIEELEKNILGGLQQLLGDGKYVVGDKLTVADLSLVAHLTLPLLGLFDASKFPKLASYYERLKAELPYFEEINRPGIVLLEKLCQDLK